MIKGSENIIKFVDTNDCAYWKIYPYSQSRDKYLFDSGDDDNLSKEKSLEKLQACLNLLSPGRYIVQCKTKASATKGYPEIAYEHESTPSTNMNAGMVTTQIGGAYDESKVQKMISDALEADRNKRKLEEYEKENAELKKQVKEYQGNGTAAVIGRVFERFEPHINTVLNHYLPPKPLTQVAGIGYAGETKTTTTTTMDDNKIPHYNKPTTPPASDEEAKKRLQEALNAWVDIDPARMLAIIETVAHTAHNDGPTYNFYANNLLK